MWLIICIILYLVIGADVYKRQAIPSRDERRETRSQIWR